MADEADREASEGSVKRSGTIQSVSIATRFLRVLANAEEPMALGAVARHAATSSPTAHGTCKA